LIRSLLANPLATLCVPPLLILLQFLDLVAIYSIGLPKQAWTIRLGPGLLLAALFGLCMPALPAMLIGIRHLIYSPDKVTSALGVAFNGLYLLGFVLFFVFFFIVKTTA
jgi:hypothetical protein